MPGTTLPWASRYMLAVALAGAFSRKSRKWTSPLARRNNRKPPPPMLPAWGSTTARAKPTATAASTALPPWRMIATPALDASGCSVATMALGACTGCIPLPARAWAQRASASTTCSSWRRSCIKMKAGLRAHLATKLRIQSGGKVIHLRRRLVNHPVALKKDGQRQIGIVKEDVRREGLEQRTPHSIKRAGTAEAGVDAAHLLAQPKFVLPVETSVGLFLCLVVYDGKLAADGADRRIAEVRDQIPKRLGIHLLADIGENENLA